MESRTFRLEVTEQQLAVIEAGLKELPGRICIPVINVLLKQVSEQDTKIEEIKKEEG